MPKELPVIASTAIATGWWGRKPAFIITLGSGTVLKYSTIDITVGSDTFVSRCKYVGPIKQTMTNAPDNVSFDLWNADAVAGLALVDPVNALKGAKATCYSIITDLTSGEHSLVEEMSGFLEIAPGSGAGDDKVTFTLISDGAVPTPVIATTQVLSNCPYWYNNATGGDGLCGYVGSITSCDKSFDGANGCTQHFGYEGARDHFGGHAMDLDPVTIQTYVPPAPPPPPPINPSPINPYNPYPIRYPDPWEYYCVTPDTPILVKTSGVAVWKLAKNVGEGDLLVNARYGTSEVLSVIEGTTTRLHVFTTENGKQLWCSPSHPILCSFTDETGQPATWFKVGYQVLTYHEGAFVTSKIAAIEILETPKLFPVVIFSLKGEHTFITGGIVSHNMKPMLDAMLMY